ncbi:MAG: Gfo/Idh/MocA family oxidoreductase [Chloroflexi bacterium]|nr:Gfo/Idh/MocA family oxidoreductase [Chloroflexota bacterium]
MVRYGIVGVGGFAATWLHSLQAVETKGVATIRAAVVRNPAKYRPQVEELRERGCTIYTSLEEMLDGEQGRIDVVGVPTGIPYHVPMAIAAMEAGYNVLIEKPICATVQKVSELKAAETRTARWCAVGYQWLYSPTIQWLKTRAAEGDIGQILKGKTLIGWPRASGYYARNAWAGRLRFDERWVLDGPATNATAHYLTNLLYLCSAQGTESARIVRVRGELYRAKPIESYDTSAIEVELASGATLLHLASHSLRASLEPEMDLIAEKASIHWQASNDQATILYHDGRSESFVNPDPERNHQRLFEGLARVVHGEAERPLCGLAEGAPHVLAIDLAFESAQGIVPIPQTQTIRDIGPDRSELVAVRGMEEALQTAYAASVSFSRINAPWAVHTEPVDADGYVHFPRDARLAANLGL